MPTRRTAKRKGLAGPSRRCVKYKMVSVTGKNFKVSKVARCAKFSKGPHRAKKDQAPRFRKAKLRATYGKTRVAAGRKAGYYNYKGAPDHPPLKRKARKKTASGGRKPSTISKLMSRSKESLAKDLQRKNAMLRRLKK